MRSSDEGVFILNAMRSNDFKQGVTLLMHLKDLSEDSIWNTVLTR